MRRSLFLAAVLAAVGAAFAVGHGAATAPAVKYGWAGPVFSKSAGLTVLEERCLKHSFRSEPLGISHEWLITAQVATPHTNGVLVRTNLTLRPGASKADAERRVGVAIREATEKIRKGVLATPTPPPGVDPTFVTVDPFKGFAHSRLEFYANGKLISATGETMTAITKKSP